MNEKTVIELCDIPVGVCREIASAIGVESAMKVFDLVGGQSIYFFKRETVERKARNRHIREEFNGSNHEVLAIRYGLSQNMIKAIVSA